MESAPGERRIVKCGVEFAVIAGERADHDAFWDWYASPDWEPETVAVYAAFTGTGAAIVDIGGWIGPTVLLGAALGAKVLAVEPDPVAAAMLRRNVALNPKLAPRVTVLEVALDTHDGNATLLSRSPDGGDSHSHLASVRDEAGRACRVATMSVASLLETVPAVHEADLFKIDAEAAEYTIVPALRDHLARARPAIYVATHPNLLYNRRSAASRARSGLRALGENRRLVRAVAGYRHHYTWIGGLRTDVRDRNVRRARLPLPVRSSLLIGAFLFTDRSLPVS